MTVVEEYFRRDGWTVSVELPGQVQSLLNVLRESWYDVIGLSIGNAGATEELTRLIRDIRKASMNGSIRVVIGGCVLPLVAEEIRRSGADLFAGSAEEAVRETAAIAEKDRNGDPNWRQTSTIGGICALAVPKPLAHMKNRSISDTGVTGCHGQAGYPRRNPQCRWAEPLARQCRCVGCRAGRRCNVRRGPDAGSRWHHPRPVGRH